MTEKTSNSFVQVPTKIFKLGLNPYELAAFFALVSHGGKGGSGIFPSHGRIAELSGQSERQVRNSLGSLAACYVIQWDRGGSGFANTYIVLGVGCWSKKKPVDKSRKRVDNSAKNSGGGRHHVPGGSAPQTQGGRHHVPPNHIQENQIQITRAGSFEKLGDRVGDLVGKLKAGKTV